MAEVTYRSSVRVVRESGAQRRAEMPGGEHVRFGVHGAIAEHYGVTMDQREPVSATLDYLVAAAGG